MLVIFGIAAHTADIEAHLSRRSDPQVSALIPCGRQRVTPIVWRLSAADRQWIIADIVVVPQEGKPDVVTVNSVRYNMSTRPTMDSIAVHSH